MDCLKPLKLDSLKRISLTDTEHLKNILKKTTITEAWFPTRPTLGDSEQLQNMEKVE